MENPQWPSVLPRGVLVEGYREVPQNKVLRSTMDVGPAKTRLRDLAATKPLPVSMVMTEDQLEIFEDFFESAIQWGVKPFDIRHPRKDKLITVMLTGEELYVVEPIGTGHTHWKVSLNLQIQP